MNHSNYWISLDINKIKSQLNLTLKQGETGRTINISLTEDGRPYQIGEGCYATFAASKTVNNETVILSHGCEIKDNTIKYSVLPETTKHTGLVECEILLYSAEGELIISSSFSITVFNNTYSEVEAEAPKEVGTLARIISEANYLIENVNNKLANGDFNGVGIVSIKKTATEGDVDTYTITLSNNTSYTFTVTNAIYHDTNERVYAIEKVLCEWTKVDDIQPNGNYSQASYYSKYGVKPLRLKGVYAELESDKEHEFDIVCNWENPYTTDNEVINTSIGDISYSYTYGVVFLWTPDVTWKEVYYLKVKNIELDHSGIT